MDIWDWVGETREVLRRDGHLRLLEIVDELPGLAVDGMHEQVDALVPEGVALARAIDHPWLEVFLRHWHAQSRIFGRCDVARGMDEVVRLLDFAHGERTANCPQSVCATQDFCAAYGMLDGPGFGEERLAASSEALARIDPTWPCFNCISAEHAEALLDLERFAEAEEFLRRQLGQPGRDDSETSVLVLKRVAALLGLARNAEAVEILDALDTTHEQRAQRMIHALRKSRAYVLVGRLEDAIAAQPDSSTLEPSEYVNWMRSELALCAARPERNTTQLGRKLRDFCTTLRDNGALYQQAEIALGAAKLALDRGRPRVAALHIEVLKDILPRLRRPRNLAAGLAELESRIPASHSDPVDAAAVLEGLPEDPELAYEALAGALRANPANDAVVIAACRAWQEMGFFDHARHQLETFVLANPESDAAFAELMRLLVAASDESRLRELAETVPPHLRASAYFYLGRLMIRRENWSGAVEAFERTREHEDSPVRATLSNLAYSYRHLGRNEEALALLDDLARSDDDFSDDWERMIVATLLGHHDKVRDSARRLGFEFEGEGPIDDPIEYCILKIRDGNGRDMDCRAIRISPVVARIVAMQAPGLPCLYRDEVLFDPFLLNERPDPPRDDFEPVYRAIRTLQPGGFRIYDLDGVYPGEAEMKSLSDALSGLGAHVSVRSSEEYLLEIEDGEPPARGVYVFVAVPRDVMSDAVYAALASVTSQWATPLTYRGLLRELDKQDELERHEKIASELKL